MGSLEKSFPIMLASCVTIHKAQGLTLDRVLVDEGQDVDDVEFRMIRRMVEPTRGCALVAAALRAPRPGARAASTLSFSCILLWVSGRPAISAEPHPIGHDVGFGPIPALVPAPRRVQRA